MIRSDNAETNLRSVRDKSHGFESYTEMFFRILKPLQPLNWYKSRIQTIQRANIEFQKVPVTQLQYVNTTVMHFPTIG